MQVNKTVSVFKGIGQFDKKGVMSTVSKSYPQILFEDLAIQTNKKIKNLSFTGVKWFRSYDFGEIIGIEYEKDFYIDYGQNNNLPIIVKSIGIINNKKLLENEIVYTWVNTGLKKIKTIEVSFSGVNKIGENIREGTILNSINIDGVEANQSISKSLKSWDNDSTQCVKITNVQIEYVTGDFLNIDNEKPAHLIYSSTDNLYPSQSIKIINCMKLLNKQ